MSKAVDPEELLDDIAEARDRARDEFAWPIDRRLARERRDRLIYEAHRRQMDRTMIANAAGIDPTGVSRIVSRHRRAAKRDRLDLDDERRPAEREAPAGPVILSLDDLAEPAPQDAPASSPPKPSSTVDLIVTDRHGRPVASVEVDTSKPPAPPPPDWLVSLRHRHAELAEEVANRTVAVRRLCGPYLAALDSLTINEGDLSEPAMLREFRLLHSKIHDVMRSSEKLGHGGAKAPEAKQSFLESLRPPDLKVVEGGNGDG